MLLSYLIIALSVSFAPLAQGRPAGAPAASLDSSHTSTEPGTLLGRHYSVQERREPSHALLPRATYKGYAKPAGYRAAASPRPYARYLADRSDDIWAHEHGRRANSGAPNYVSYVGSAPPAPPEEPIEPITPVVDISPPPPAPAAPAQPSAPTPGLTDPSPGSTSLALTSPSATSTSPSSATATASAKKLKNTKAKGKSKGRKGAKPAAKS